ncbi:U2 small nuclear ribonucleoprotein A', putative [Giardia lamblia P15]|uniref:U2 small nuclear ribonucleoprotein A', putative n=1 Tax=Giardia intestinalis (strain P15) TaxID=658858 RepID=E1EWF2_GIAIA|nr:U2 small nuclear ribonucleoprotein A', putative [Giardia lamblia P15]
MVKITLELLRKRSEHNDSILDTLEEIALHQYMIRKIELIGDVCRNLQILLLQNNKIRRIENLSTLKKLKYLNLAINRVAKLENLASLESLEKLDLTANYIHNYLDFATLGHLSRLTELYVVGNPLTTYPYWREYLITVLPHLEKLDGHEITRTDRILASSIYNEHLAEITATSFREYDTPHWDEDSDNSDYEDRDANIKVKRAAEETASAEYRNRNILPEERHRPPRTVDPSTGLVRQYNELGFTFQFEEDASKREICCKIMVPIHMQTNLLEIDVDPFSILLISKESKKQMQIAWPYEIFADSVVCRRITSTGALKIYVRVVDPSVLQEGIWASSSKQPTNQTPVVIASNKDVRKLEPVVHTQDVSDSDIEGSIPSDLPELEGV